MLTIISAVTIALALSWILILKARRTNPVRLDEARGELLMVGVQIVCGNCCGDGESPNRTYLDRYGNCAECGGYSYVLASSLALNSAALKAARLVQGQSAASNGRVLPFEVRPRESRSEKIAV
jgi:hypothetical protein